jgi:hypothetical protein
VNISGQEYQQLQEILKTLRTEFNASKSQEETLFHFQSAIQTLKQLRLLPDTFNNNQLNQALVEHLNFGSPWEMRIHRNVSNICCLVYGQVTNSITITPLTRAVTILTFAGIIPYNMVDKIFNNLSKVPFVLVSRITLGNTIFKWHEGQTYEIDDPSQGYIDTFGILGKRNFQSTSLYGALPLLPFSYGGFAYPAIMGFNGIRLCNTRTGVTTYIGSAVWARIETHLPYSGKSS